MLKYNLIFLIPCVFGKFRFDNYTLYKILPKSVEQVKLLQDLQDDLRYDFWNDPMPSAEFVNILSSPTNKRDLEYLLNGNEIKFNIAMDNIQE